MNDNVVTIDNNIVLIVSIVTEKKGAAFVAQGFLFLIEGANEQVFALSSTLKATSIFYEGNLIDHKCRRLFPSCEPKLCVFGLDSLD